MEQDFFKSKVLGHPSGLFVLFFTEMWERFSFYGMRVLLIQFLTMAAIGYNPGWEWSASNATALFGTYAMLLYLTPILGGIIADKLTGYRWAVVIGAIIMTLGHVAMAIETEFWLYMGLALLVIGTGFFKPNMSSIISEMYKDVPEKKDGAYTIFYMGVNAGAFFGMMLCGYLAERVGWSWGFGLAGVFMLLGTLQFWLAKPLFGSIGDVPKKGIVEEKVEKSTKFEEEKEIEKRNPFTTIDKVLIVITSIIGLGYAINDPLSKIADIDIFGALKFGGLEGQYVAVITGLVLFLFLTISRISRYTRIVRDRMIAFVIFAFFTVFFWMSFEQGATSLILFARDSVNRTLSGNSAIIFNIVNSLLTIVPLAIITYVLVRLAKETYNKIKMSNVVLAICFVGVWAVVLWMLNNDWSSKAYEVAYQEVKTTPYENSYTADEQVFKTYKENLISGDFITLENDKEVAVKVDSFAYNNVIIKRTKSKLEDKKAKGVEQEELNKQFVAKLLAIKDVDNVKAFYEVKKDSAASVAFSKVFFKTPITENRQLSSKHEIITTKKVLAEPVNLKVGQEINIITKDNEGEAYGYLGAEALEIARKRGVKLNRDNGIVKAKVAEIKSNEVEITVSWFSILNSFFIIAFASMFSKLWESKYNPSAAGKYALGLIIMGAGFGLLAFAAYGMKDGVRVSMVWLILAYLLHTLGELCLSPVGLSYVSKLVPSRMIAFMFGMWYLAIAIGNKLAAILGGQIEKITEEYSLSTFFLIFTVVPAIAGLLVLVLNPVLKKLMHGVK